MAKNHIIIGLGGTGGKVIREFRKNIFQDFRVKDFSDLFEEENNVGLRSTRVRYVYLDSSETDLNNVDQWRILGDDVALAEESKVLLKKQRLSSILNNIEQAPNIKPWIGSADDWPDTIASGSETAAGQKRRYGRFLLATNMASVKNVVVDQASKIQRDSNIKDITFHVCCGIAGGTGSGTLVDVITQIRNEYPPDSVNKYEILLYVQLPERSNKLGWAQKNYYANGYATLSELNALMVKRFQPWDVLKGKSALEVTYPFNACFICTDENEVGMSLDVQQELPKITSDFLYHKIAFDQEGQLDALARLTSGENADEIVEKDRYDNLARSKRFLSFGIKRVAVPVEEIREYFAYRFAQQGVLALKYDHWTSNNGYINEPAPEAFAGKVKTSADSWLISDDYLTYSKPVLGEKDYETIDTEWQVLIAPFVEQTKRSSQSGREWNTALMKNFEAHYARTFREVGVDLYYQQAERDKANIAEKIRRHIDYLLFESMKNGTSSVYKVAQTVDALITYIDQKAATVDERIKRAQRDVTTYEGAVNDTFQKITKVGPLSETFFSKKSRLLDVQAQNLKDWYTARTWLRAWQFARELMPLLRRELNKFKDDSRQALGKIEEALDTFNRLVAERCDDAGSYSDRINQRVVRFYHADAVREHVHQYTTHKKERINEVSTKLRNELFGHLEHSKNYSFARFSDTDFSHQFVSRVESVAANHLDELYRAMEPSEETKRLVEPNIVQKLYEEFGSNQKKLYEFIKQVVQSASCYATFSNEEMGIDTTVKDHLFIILPEHDNQDFLNLIKNSFEKSKSGFIHFITTSNVIQEITILNVKSMFPLRYLSVVSYLRKCYQDRVDTDGEGARFILHTEGDGSALPPLFRPTTQENQNELAQYRQEAVKFLLLAHAMQLLSCQEDPQSGQKMVMLQQPGNEQDGRTPATPLAEGETLIDAYRSMSKPDIDLLIKTVNDEFRSVRFKHQRTRQEVLKPAVITQEERIYVQQGKNDLDPIVIAFTQGRKEAVTLLTP